MWQKDARVPENERQQTAMMFLKDSQVVSHNSCPAQFLVPVHALQHTLFLVAHMLVPEKPVRLVT